MLFRVRGTNKDTHALMVLDVEAANRPAAQYKAESRRRQPSDQRPPRRRPGLRLDAR